VRKSIWNKWSESYTRKIKAIPKESKSGRTKTYEEVRQEEVGKKKEDQKRVTATVPCVGTTKHKI